MLSIEGPFKVNWSFETHWLTFAEGGVGGAGLV